LAVEVDENYVYEVDKDTKMVRKRCSLKDLEIIRIVDMNQNYSNDIY